MFHSLFSEHRTKLHCVDCKKIMVNKRVLAPWASYIEELRDIHACGRCQPLSSVQFSRSVVSDSLQPHELKQARPLCPSPKRGVYPNSCPLSW